MYPSEAAKCWGRITPEGKRPCRPWQPPQQRGWRGSRPKSASRTRVRRNKSTPDPMESGRPPAHRGTTKTPGTPTKRTGRRRFKAPSGEVSATPGSHQEPEMHLKDTLEGQNLTLPSFSLSFLQIILPWPRPLFSSPSTSFSPLRCSSSRRRCFSVPRGDAPRCGIACRPTDEPPRCSSSRST